MAQTTTDVNGLYQFTGLVPGDYLIKEQDQAGWTHLSPVTINQDNLTSGQNLTNQDFINTQLGSISGHKYVDADGSLATTGDETGVSGWTITLYNDANHNNVADAGEQVAQTTTDGSGAYQFTGLAPGDYIIKEENKAGWTHLSPVQINQNSLTAGQDLTNQDFVNFKLFEISGHKFEDVNGDDGTPGNTGDDKPWEGVTIFIDANNNQTLDNGELQTTTDANGFWQFTGLDASYAGDKVYEVLPGGSVQTLGSAGYTITGTSGADQDDLDFANFKLFEISGHKFEDINGDDGTPGNTGDDKPWEGVTIFIDANNNQTLDNGELQTTTDANGFWQFTGLDASYAGDKVYEVLPGGSVQTLGSAGYTITGTSGADQDDLDFANFKFFSVSGTKYEDLTGNGKTGDDIPWSHDPVTIYIDINNNHVFDAGDLSTTTGAGGAWSIGGLTLADVGKSIYEVVPDGSEQTGILVQTVDNPGSGGVDIGNDFTNFLPPPGQGLTPGFWKNHIDILNQELGEYHSGWTSKTSFETIFEFQNLNIISGNPSIADALAAKGGGIHHLERSSAAAYLSAAVTAVPDGLGGKPELNFSFSAATSSDPAIISILNLIDANHDHTLQPIEVAGAVRDVLNDTNAPTSNFGETGQPGINDVANAFDAMNNQLHPDASVFLV
ncbi:MAG: hypothetical protein EOS37_25135 [Mesorhizobium sp.]|nr:MAG: hypothetical protein EOS37_25135 [Mesorhizobium sp.]